MRYHNKTNDNNHKPVTYRAHGEQATTLFISSSMFRYLDESKLSTPLIKAKKFFFPGADATIMQAKLKQDNSFLAIPPASVSSIYVMCGTNNVNSVYYGSCALGKGIKEVSSLLKYLKVRFPNTQINVLSVLPRGSDGRNDVVDEINCGVKEYCEDNSLRFMDVNQRFKHENGSRRNQYFIPPSVNIRDNCHLSQQGMKCLGKYLKYWAHSNLGLNE